MKLKCVARLPPAAAAQGAEPADAEVRSKEAAKGRRRAAKGSKAAARGQRIAHGAKVGVLLGAETKEQHPRAAKMPHRAAVKGLLDGPKARPRRAARMPQWKVARAPQQGPPGSRYRRVWDPGIAHPRLRGLGSGSGPWAAREWQPTTNQATKSVSVATAANASTRWAGQ